ncbi:MAG: ABC transporter ATP-binding protein, partial [Anaerolineales bacterium]|nr:ABC transporter ATP-binding protein [Anaerolineales bacterium]
CALPIYVDEVIEEIAQVPPLVELGRKLGWRPVPLTIKAGRRFARKWVNGPASGEDRQPITNGQRFSSSTNKSPLLQVQEAWFEYGRDVAALRGVDVQLRAGEVVALMGRNGSGKTTLLRGIVNLLRFDGGQVQINGRLTDNRSTAEICREVAYLPQNPDDLLFAETVREELWQTLRNHGLSATETAVDKLLAEVGLSEVAEAYPRDLSVGQRQRVALAAVMVTNPKLLLLDEPTRGLDYEAKAALVSLWQRWQQQGMGMLLVTHDVELVAQVANRVVVLSQGEVIAAGPTAEVLTASPLFAPQMAKLFPDKQWLTVADVVG